jgi:hypothetical protein
MGETDLGALLNRGQKLIYEIRLPAYSKNSKFHVIASHSTDGGNLIRSAHLGMRKGEATT